MRRPSAAAISPATAVIGLFLTFGLIVASFFPFLSVYFAGRGFDPSEIGLLLSAMALVRIVAMPVWGHVADTRIGRKRALQLGLVGMVVFAIVASVLDTLVGVAFGAVGIAIAMAASGPNIDALALVQLGEERMSEYGRIRGWESLSYAAGCLAFGWLLDIHGVTLALPLYAATGALMLVWTTIAVRSDRPKEREHHGRLGAVGAVFRTAPRFWGFLVATLLVWTGFNAAWNFVGLKIEEPLLIGVGTALGGLTEVGVMRLSSRLHRTYRAAQGLRPRMSGLRDRLPPVGTGRRHDDRLPARGLRGRRLLPPVHDLDPGGRQAAALVALLERELDRGDGGLRDRAIIGAGAGGFIYDRLGSTTLFLGASIVALLGGVAAMVALKTPELDTPLPEPTLPPEEVAPEPGRM